MNLSCVQVQSLYKLPNCPVPVTFPGSSPFLHNHLANPSKSSRNFRSHKDGIAVKRKGGIVRGWLLPVDPWAPNIDSESIASQVFAVSLFPYIGFLYFITKSKSAPKLTFFASTSCLPLSGPAGKGAYHDNGASASCNVSVRVLETLVSAFAHFEPGPVPPGIYGNFSPINKNYFNTY